MLMLASSDDPVVQIIAFSIMGLIALAWVVSHNIRKGGETRQREQTRREVAAYIAEGSMTPEQGRDLLAAGESGKGKC